MLVDSKNPFLIGSCDSGKLYLNRYQAYKGRVMFVYSKHLVDFSELGTEDFSIHMILVRLTRAIKAVNNAELINIASLGNECAHLHWHLIPRRKEDLNISKNPWPYPKITASEREVKETVTWYKKVLLPYLPDFKF
jgi:diadenosine tetraphosphate (Ap4A) HIT family hydrolase